MRSTKALRLPVLAGLIAAVGCGSGGGSSSARPDGEFRVTGSMALPRMDFTATRLADGRVLVVGGSNHPTTSASAEIYDPESGTFAPTGALVGSRAYHVAALLPDDQVWSSVGPVGQRRDLDPFTAVHRHRHAGGPLQRDRDRGRRRVLVMGGIDVGRGRRRR
jgi:hypothetical protein